MLIEVSEPSQAGDARRRAVELAERLEMGETQCGQVAIAATEIATNLVKHALRGHILVDQLNYNGHRGLRITGADKGPGIADVGKALEDGNSTGNSLGSGLGAIKRLSDSFEVYTVPRGGTIVDAIFWKKKPASVSAVSLIEVGCVSEPMRGEQVNGDGWAVKQSAESVLLMVVDGLGHGALASEAAREAERIFDSATSSDAETIVRDIHDALRKTRGAAGAVAKIDVAKQLLFFAGVGNISATVVTPKSARSLPSHNGTLGHQMARLQQFSCPWQTDSLLVMHSDGLTSKWDLSRYPGIFSKAPGVIAAVLHRDFYRQRDDATVLVARSTNEGRADR